MHELTTLVVVVVLLMIARRLLRWCLPEAEALVRLVIGVVWRGSKNLVWRQPVRLLGVAGTLIGWLTVLAVVATVSDAGLAAMLWLLVAASLWLWRWIVSRRFLPRPLPRRR